MKIKTIKNKFHILFSPNFYEKKKSNKLLLNFFISILEKVKIAVLQFTILTFNFHFCRKPNGYLRTRIGLDYL